MPCLTSNYRIVALLLFFVLPLMIGVPSYAPAADGGKKGGVIILLQERLKSPFKLSSYKVLLDGKPVLEKRLGEMGLTGITINGLPEGKYRINVTALYSGSGYGLFDYHKDYKYPLESETEVKIEAGKVTSLKIICNDRDGFLADLDKRPYKTYHTSRIKFPYEPDEKRPETLADEKKAEIEEPIKADNGLETVKADSAEGVVPEIDLSAERIMARHLTGLSVEKDNRLKVIVLADGMLREYQVKKLDKPDRIVIDIKGVREQLKVDSLDVGGSVIKKVRVGQHPGYARIVLDTPGKPFLDYDIKPTTTGLIVNISDNQDEPATSPEKVESLNNARHLTGISVEKVKGGVRVFVAGDGSFGDYKSRRMDKPDRLVVDIIGVKELLDVDGLSVNSPLLKGVRVGQHPGMARVVLDFTAGAKINYDLKTLPDGLLIAVLEK